MANLRRFVRPGAQVLLIFFVTFGTAARVQTWSTDKKQDSARAAYQRLDSLRQPGDQLLLVFIGSARCRWSTNPALPSLVANVRDSLADFARRNELRFGTLGIAVDVLKDEGMRHLATILDFDEVTAGGSWLNETATRYVWDRYGAPAATPQLFVIRRRVIRERTGGGAQVAYSREDETLLARKMGLGEIEEWVRNGIRLSRTDAARPVPQLPLTAVPRPSVPSNQSRGGE